MINFTKRFKKDMRKWRQSCQNLQPLDEFISLTTLGWPPHAKYEAHLLTGTFEGTWDVHLKKNMILLLQYRAGTVYFLRIGTHADLGL